MSDTTVKEIITLQLGHYANYIGTHWWNFQEASFVYDAKNPTDLNHDYYFQSGKTHLGQETFTPRLVVVDSQGSTGALNLTGALYSDPAEEQVALTTSLKGQPSTIVRQQPYPRNAFLQDLHQQETDFTSATQKISLSCNSSAEPLTAKVYDLRNSIYCWSDYLRPHFHPDTICLLPGVWHSQVGGCADALAFSAGMSGAATPRPREGGGFEPSGGEAGPEQHRPTAHSSQPGLEQLWSFSEGVQAARAQTPFEDVSDAVRRLAERSNCVQGFQVICHGYDGMGGVASVACELLQDNYSTKTILCLPATPPTTSLLRSSARTPLLVNTMLAFSSLGPLCDVLLPLNLRQHAWRPDGPLASWPLFSYQPNSLYESSSLLATFLECFTSALRTREAPLTLYQLAACLTPRQQKVVSGRLQLPARPSVTGGGERVSGTIADDTASPLASIVTRRGHNCAPSAQGVAPLWQLRDPLPTGSPFPTQMINGLSLPPGINYVGSVSCESSVVQSLESRVFVRQLLQDCEKLRPAQLACYGVTSDVWQQAITDWRELAENYGADNAEEDDSD